MGSDTCKLRRFESPVRIDIGVSWREIDEARAETENINEEGKNEELEGIESEGYSEWHFRHHVRPVSGGQQHELDAGKEDVFCDGQKDIDSTGGEFDVFSERTKYRQCRQKIHGKKMEANLSGISKLCLR